MFWNYLDIVGGDCKALEMTQVMEKLMEQMLNFLTNMAPQVTSLGGLKENYD